MYFDWVSFFYFGLLGLIAVWGGVLAWQRYKLPDFAGQVYDSNIEKGLLNPAIAREAYVESYVRSEAPRAGVFRCATALFSLLTVPALVSMFNRIWDMGWRALGAVEGPYERGYMLHTFMTFVVVMAVIVGLLYVVTAFYYRTAPPTLAQEIKRLEGELG